jgi:hypothetical protein
MMGDELLLSMLKSAGLSQEVIDANLPALRKFWVESKAREVDFWGKYFVSCGKHYRKHHQQMHGVSK